MLVLLRKREGKRLRALMEAHLRAKTDAFLATLLNDGLVSASVDRIKSVTDRTLKHRAKAPLK